ncbi:MAG: hypothetical protein NZ870_03015, partial [bacterium]|nr:hypothetical protein [bacterium]
MIKFGTDGFRGIISYDFNFENVNKIAYSISKCLEGSFAIGYDGRFLSKYFANIIAAVLAAKNKVYISLGALPTPAVAVFINRKKIDYGVVVTASHNPYYYNGIKLRKYPGISVGSNITSLVEKNLFLGDYTGRPKFKDIKKFYLEVLKNRFNFKKSFLCDCMYGVTSGLLINFGGMEIRNKVCPHFLGIKPEPNVDNIEELRKICYRYGKVGFAFDGDGDRILVVTEDGRALTTLEGFSLYTYLVVKNKVFKAGKILKTVSLGSTVDMICKDFGFEVEEVPVGFKHIANRLGVDAIFGGEESGGIGWTFWVPERDAIFNALFLLELLDGM